MTYSGPKPVAAATTSLTPENASQARRLLSFILGSAEEESRLAKCASDRAQLALECYKDRRARDRIFSSELFADPAWDILLILYWASHSQQRLSVTSVCASAAVPPTTGLRWIENLIRLGMLRKEKHPTDGRVTWLDLSDQARQPLDQYFDAILANQAASTLTRLRAA